MERHSKGGIVPGAIESPDPLLPGERFISRKRMTDAELIAALRRKPYDRAAREAADRLEELTVPKR